MAKISLPSIVSPLPGDLRRFLQRVKEAIVGLESNHAHFTAGTSEPRIKVDYAAGDLTTATEIAAALNAVGGSINSIITKLEDVAVISKERG